MWLRGSDLAQVPPLTQIFSGCLDKRRSRPTFCPAARAGRGRANCGGPECGADSSGMRGRPSKEGASRRRGREMHPHVGKEEHDSSRGVRRGACLSVKRASVFVGRNCEAAFRTGIEGSSKLKTCKRLRPPGRQVLVWSASACVRSRHSLPEVGSVISRG